CFRFDCFQLPQVGESSLAERQDFRQWPAVEIEIVVVRDLLRGFWNGPDRALEEEFERALVALRRVADHRADDFFDLRDRFGEYRFLDLDVVHVEILRHQTRELVAVQVARGFHLGRYRRTPFALRSLVSRLELAGVLSLFLRHGRFSYVFRTREGSADPADMV